MKRDESLGAAPRIYAFTFETPFGWMGLSAGGKGLAALALPQADRESAARKLGELLRSRGVPLNVVETPAEGSLLRRARDSILEYLSGERAKFRLPIDLGPLTSFQRRVLRVTASIPYAQVRTYKWVATAAGRPGAARAVGQALSQNPLPIVIPCHRVIRSDGGLGGFSAGLDRKVWLLDLERGGAAGFSSRGGCDSETLNRVLR